jgi:hypothetical protein
MYNSIVIPFDADANHTTTSPPLSHTEDAQFQNKDRKTIRHGDAAVPNPLKASPNLRLVWADARFVAESHVSSRNNVALSQICRHCESAVVQGVQSRGE